MSSPLPSQWRRRPETFDRQVQCPRPCGYAAWETVEETAPTIARGGCLRCAYTWTTHLSAAPFDTTEGGDDE